MSSVPLKELNVDELQHYFFDVLEHLRNKSCVDFVKAARLGFYYSKQLNDYLQDEAGVPPEQVDVVFSNLLKGLEGSAITDADLSIASAGSYDEALSIGRDLVGHYNPTALLEIRHPRMSEDRGSLESYVKNIYENRDVRIENFHKQQEARDQAEQEVRSSLGEAEAEEFDRILKNTQTYMALRETVKYYFAAEYSLARNALLELGSRLDLENIDDIFSVYPDEMPRLIDGTYDFKPIINERKRSFDNYLELDMPSIIRESDIDELSLVSDAQRLTGEVAGSYMAEGAYIEDGVVVNMDEIGSSADIERAIQEAREKGLNVILVARQLDISSGSLLGIVDGVVVENGASVSHAAQCVREAGIGGITGIRSRNLLTGTRITFNPQDKTITVH